MTRGYVTHLTATQSVTGFFVRREASLCEPEKIRPKVQTRLIKTVNHYSRYAQVRKDGAARNTTVSYDHMLSVPIPTVPSRTPLRDPSTGPQPSAAVPSTVLSYPALFIPAPRPLTRTLRRSKRLQAGQPASIAALELDALYPHIYRRWRVVSHNPNDELYRVRSTNLSPSHETYEHARFVAQSLIHALRRQKISTCSPRFRLEIILPLMKGGGDRFIECYYLN